MKKNINNITEEIVRIKSLFGESRLSGNLVEESEDDSPLGEYGIFDDIENDLMEMSDRDRSYYLQSIISFCQDLLYNSEYDDDDDDDDDDDKLTNRTIFGGGEYDNL